MEARPLALSPKDDEERQHLAQTDEDEDDHDLGRRVDNPLLAVEVSIVLQGVLALLLVLAGLGFFTVKPPGEQDLCTAEALGLQNETEHDRDWDLKCCHALYSGVFNILGVVGAVHLGCGCMGVATTLCISCGAIGVYRQNVGSSFWWFCCGVFADLMGLLVVWLPSMLFPELAVVVSAGLAPIHAYFITIMVGHYGMQFANSSHQGLGGWTSTEEVLYQGYSAASRVEQCLTIGSIALVVLFWLYVVDVGRNVLALTCWRPKYDEVDGIQLLLVLRRLRARCRPSPGGEHREAPVAVSDSPASSRAPSRASTQS